MYLFEENEYVIYKGNNTDLSESRRNPSLAIVDKIDENKFPYVGLKLVPSGEMIWVEARLIRNLMTDKEHLLNLGFQKTVENNVEYFTLGNLIINGIVIYPRPRMTYFAGFRIVPGILSHFNASPYITNGEVDEVKLEMAFPNVNNLNKFVEQLNQQGLSSKSIPEIVEIKPYY